MKEQLGGWLEKAGLELGGDPAYNRRYLAELAVAYTFAALALYVLLTFSSTALIGSESPPLRGLAAVAYIFNYYMCHQLPERSLFLFGEPMGLCTRCAAIFVGALAAFPASLLRRRLPGFMQSWLFVAAALAPIALDGTTQLFGWRESNNYERALTGFIAALAVMYYLLTGLLERYSTGKTLFRKGLAIPTLIPLAFLVIPVLAAGIFVGGNYKSADYAVGEAMNASPGAGYYAAYYIPPHATQTIPGDSYLSAYSDPILRDVASHRNFSAHQLGVWAGVALSSPPARSGNYAYFSSGSGDYYYFDAWDGKLILRATH